MRSIVPGPLEAHLREPWESLAPEARASLNAGVEEAERGEFADLTPVETEHYLKTGELPERVERWLDSYDSRPRT